MPKPFIIGIAGGIGSGKSVVSRVLRLVGYTVYDCDTEARRLMEASQSLPALLRGRFGDSCYLDDGSLNRRHLAACIFGNDADRLWLNAIVHKEVRGDVEALAAGMSEQTLPQKRLLFVESAVLASSGLAAMCSAIWLVTAPETTRLTRAMTRDAAPREDILKRMAAQRAEEALLPRGLTVEIDNSDSGALLHAIPRMAAELEEISENNK